VHAGSGVGLSVILQLCVYSMAAEGDPKPVFPNTSHNRDLMLDRPCQTKSIANGFYLKCQQ